MVLIIVVPPSSFIHTFPFTEKNQSAKRGPIGQPYSFTVTISLITFLRNSF